MMRWRGTRSIVVPSAIVVFIAIVLGVIVEVRHPGTRHSAHALDRRASETIRTLLS